MESGEIRRQPIEPLSHALLGALDEVAMLVARADDPASAKDLAWLLVLDSLVFAAEAEVRWLDHCESRLARAAADRPAGAAGVPTTAPTTTSSRTEQVAR